MTGGTNASDHLGPAQDENSYPICHELRKGCAMGHADRYNDGARLPLTAAQRQQIVHDSDSFPSVHDAMSAGGSSDGMTFSAAMPPIRGPRTIPIVVAG